MGAHLAIACVADSNSFGAFLFRLFRRTYCFRFFLAKPYQISMSRYSSIYSNSFSLLPLFFSVPPQLLFGALCLLKRCWERAPHSPIHIAKKAHFAPPNSLSLSSFFLSLCVCMFACDVFLKLRFSPLILGQNHSGHFLLEKFYDSICRTDS